MATPVSLVTQVDTIFDKVSLSDDEIEALKSTLDTYAYQGFDPIVVVNELLRKAETQQQFKKDLTRLIAIGVKRGTNLEKIQGRSSTEASTAIRELIARYNIKTGSPRTSTDITMARILAIAPHVVARVLKSAKDVTLVTGGVAISATFLPLSFPGAIAIIPKDAAFTGCSQHQERALDRKSGNREGKAPIPVLTTGR